MKIESGERPEGIGTGDMQELWRGDNSTRIIVIKLDRGRIQEKMGRYVRVVRQQPPRDLTLPPEHRGRLII